MTYRPDWYREWAYSHTESNGYKIEVPNSATDKVIVGNRRNELLDLVICLFDLVNILDDQLEKGEKRVKDGAVSES